MTMAWRIVVPVLSIAALALFATREGARLPPCTIDAHETQRPLPPPLRDALAMHGDAALLVNFWATWCAPCVAELPSLRRAASSTDGLSLVAIATETESADTVRFLERHGLEDMAVIYDPALRLARAASVHVLPTTLLVTRDGAEYARLERACDLQGDALAGFLARPPS